MYREKDINSVASLVKMTDLEIQKVEQEAFENIKKSLASGWVDKEQDKEARAIIALRPN